MVHLLHLSAGETVLKFHHDSLSIYKGGYYSAIGDIVPDNLLSHCSVFAQTLEGLLLVIGYKGASSRKEEQVYKSVEAAYFEAIKMALIEKAVDGLGAVGMSDFSPIVNSNGPWPVEGHKVFSILREISTGERKLETDPTSWATNAS